MARCFLIFDPTDEETPAGLIRGELQGAYGNIADGADSQVLRNAGAVARVRRTKPQRSFVLAADGSLSGDITDVFTGGDAARERAFLKES